MKDRKATSSLKSGLDSKTGYVAAHGGMPPTKSVEAIEKENMPKKAPNSVGR